MRKRVFPCFRVWDENSADQNRIARLRGNTEDERGGAAWRVNLVRSAESNCASGRPLRKSVRPLSTERCVVMDDTLARELLAAIKAQTEALNAQAAAIDRLAESNMLLVDVIAQDLVGEERPAPAQYLDGSSG